MHARWLLALGALLGGFLGVAGARNFADLTLEELLRESVTSVSLREQRIGDVASAISVMSNEDLRRTGVSSVADAMRLVPGMNVGYVSAGHWAVSARGFNHLYANKLLVLVDGRPVYMPLFAGVYWDTTRPMLEDVDRIEVIRGPGATVWGANAVNGVINVVTRNAADTQGTFVYGGLGSDNEWAGGVRYGGAAGEKVFYRVFAESQRSGPFRNANGGEAKDAWLSRQIGTRFDYLPEAETKFTWQADFSLAEQEDDPSHGYLFSTLGRWVRNLEAGGHVEAQIYYDRAHRDETIRSIWTSDTADVSLHHTFDPDERHTVVWGAGYRFTSLRVGEKNPTAIVTNPELDLHLASVFVQDEFRIVPEKWVLTGGVKLEHNDFTGVEVQPSVRTVWKPTPAQTVWGAISRAVRTPSALEDQNVFVMESGAPFPGPDGEWYVPILTGDDAPDSEVVWSYELGWRTQPGRRVSVDVAAFYNRYLGLIMPDTNVRFVPGLPFGQARMPFTNVGDGTTYGAEINVVVSPTEGWKLNVSHSILIQDLEIATVHIDPKHQTVVRSSHDLGDKVTIDLQLRRVGDFYYTDFVTTGRVPPYTEADVRLAYRPNKTLEISVTGRSLLNEQHQEQGFMVYATRSEVPRRVFGQVTLRF